MFMKILSSMGQSLASLANLITAPVAATARAQGTVRLLLWLVHGLAIVAILIGLWWLNDYLELEKSVRFPSTIVRSSWLPILFLLGYALGWQVWWMMRLVRQRVSVSPYPDLDQAWTEATEQLMRNGVSLVKEPLFLVLGQTTAGDANFCSAAGLSLTQPPTPRGADAPLRIWADERGVFVSLRDASLLGLQASRLQDMARAAEESNPMEVVVAGSDPYNEPVYSDFLSGESSGVAVMPKTQKKLESTAVSAESKLDEAESNLALAFAEPSANAMIRTTPRAEVKTTVEITKEEIDETLDRLDYVIDLIRHARAPYCTHNGVIVLVPGDATENLAVAQQTAVFMQHDLQQVRQASEVAGPVTAIFCDAEQFNGCDELLRRFPEEHRRRRFGAELPNIPVADFSNIKEILHSGVRWVNRSLASALVYRIFAQRDSFHGDQRREIESNRMLYQFVSSLDRRSDAILRILTRGLYPEHHGDWMPAGWYLAATGSDPLTQQGFLPGVMTLVFNAQNFVSWTEDARRRDRMRNWFTIFGYAGLGVAVLALLIVALTKL
ncbi:type VI secretion protein IcmF/TssM N-terminal domain-containing protein [Blastopirellula marina]|nr:type VI secretion protein IcmF/TssM N-terminal domain-containing protein [Blastopirellula marina]